MSTATLAPASRRAVAAPPRPRSSPERIAAIVAILLVLGAAAWSFADVGISVPDMIASWGNAEHFLARALPLEFPPLGELLWSTALTLGIVIVGTLLAAVLSLPVAYLAASNTTPGSGWRVAGRSIGVVSRAVPDVVIAMILAGMFTLGALPGIIAIGIHSIGMISKLFADAIEQIDEGPRRAIRATGGSTAQQFFSGVLPQVAPSFVATILHRNDINLRGSVILGYVGVVGLGHDLAFALQSLDYALAMGLALVIFVLCIAMEIVSSAVRTSLLGITPNGRGLGDRTVRAAVRAGRSVQGRRGAETAPGIAARAERAPFASRGTAGFADVDAAMRRPWTASRRKNTVWLSVTALVIVAAVWVCDIQWGDLLTFWKYVPAVLAKLWPPSFGNYLPEQMFGAMAETIQIALAATLLSLVLSLVVGSLAARNIAPNRATRVGARLSLVVVRGIPELILAIVLIVITGFGPQAGVLALGFCGIGLLGKLFADSFEEVSPGPERALRAGGATRLQVYAAATMPPSTKAIVGHSFYMLDTNLRAATILGIVGGGGIGFYLNNAGRISAYDEVMAIVLMMTATVLVVEGLASWIRKALQ
ncbi:phosphonate ABC transporter, permease protein PhnE [Microterricola viridarii]|uniref:Phosphate starvation-inducible protein PhoH n=1 Tax=Microterricola viridarii TaxID=412690 RepID=A0A0Y0PG53_9MICO|nr:phosphonate ABC transporter, permease protein PhnE [Microterricola viridarii]AMB60173.1 phosphate starvation-inducible protein PhoH [Microterricola viridarii]